MTLEAPQSDQAVLRLLAAAKKQPPPADKTVDAVDYDWQSPRRFSPAQLEDLGRLAASAAQGISAALNAQFRDQIEIEPGPISQHYVGRLSTPDGPEANYYVPLMAQGEVQRGFVAIPEKRAQSWVAKIFGLEGPAAEGKKLSALEASFLTDVVAAAAKAFNEVFQPAGCAALRWGKEVSTNSELPSDDPTMEYTTLPFRQSGGEAVPVFSFVLASESIAPAVCPAVLARSAEEAKKDLLAGIGQVPVKCTVRGGDARLTVREIAELEEGDVLLLSGKIGDAVDLVVQGKVILSGYPVQHGGRYALQFVGLGPAARRGTQHKDR